MHIRRSLYNLNGKEAFIKESKTHSGVRKISIGANLCNLLTEYKGWQIEQKSKLDAPWLESDYIFTRDDGQL